MIDPVIAAAVIAWMGDVAGGTVTRAERFVHTRPMWTVDVRRPDGSLVELFARGDRGPASALSSVYDLAREATIVAALTRAGVPTPRFVAYEPDAKVLLLERVHGRSDVVALPDTARRDRIARHFIEVIADLHALDADALGLDELVIPRTADEMALTELRIGEQLFDDAGYVAHPIVTLSREWLYANVPRTAVRPSFLQGDTGPGNFMFEGDRVTHLVDWEISHFGDPMEDLAAICVRDMVTPFAHLPSLFARYGEVSGTAVDLHRVRYHRVSKCVRSLFAILSFTSQPSDAPEFATWQAWRLLYLKSACQALAEAMGGTGTAEVQSLYRDAHQQVEQARSAMGALADRSFAPLT
ncbi:MAG: phosphotransferase family protein [Acidimicrobiales bacterium]